MPWAGSAADGGIAVKGTFACWMLYGFRLVAEMARAIQIHPIQTKQFQNVLRSKKIQTLA